MSGFDPSSIFHWTKHIFPLQSMQMIHLSWLKYYILNFSQEIIIKYLSLYQCRRQLWIGVNLVLCALLCWSFAYPVFIKLSTDHTIWLLMFFLLISPQMFPWTGEQAQRSNTKRSNTKKRGLSHSNQEERAHENVVCTTKSSSVGQVITCENLEAPTSLQCIIVRRVPTSSSDGSSLTVALSEWTGLKLRGES